MSEKTNLTRFKSPSNNEVLIKQWQTFNQKTYLRSNLKLEYNQFIDVLSQNLPIIEIWEDIIRPGFLSKTLIEPYRNINYSNIDFNSADLNKNLNFFLFTIRKEGVAWVKNDLSVYDPSILSGVQFVDVNAIYWYAPAVFFNGCFFKNSNIDYIYAYQMRLNKSQLINFTSNVSVFNNSEGDLITWERNIFEGCTFIGTDFSNIKHVFSTAKNSTFRGCKFKMRNDVNVDTMFNITHSNFRYCTGKIVMPNTNEFNNLDCTGSIFESGSVIQGWCQNNNYFGTSMSDITFDWFLHNSSFKQTLFQTAPTFGPNSEIDGCNFTDSNIDDYFTKEELKAAVNSYDERTVWVDGTPL